MIPVARVIDNSLFYAFHWFTSVLFVDYEYNSHYLQYLILVVYDYRVFLYDYLTISPVL
jgi:hypothetical protein